jgi:ribosomal protein L37AE/L43A
MLCINESVVIDPKQITNMQCPKCKYERKESDTSPIWQCPQCGIAMERYAQLMEENDRRLRDSRKEQARSDKATRSQWRLFYLAVLLSPIIILGLKSPGWEKVTTVLLWFAFAAWLLGGAYLMKSSGYFITEYSGTYSKEERPSDFKLYVFLCILGAVGAVVMGVRTLLGIA